MNKELRARVDAIIQGIFRFDVLTRLPRTGFLIRGVDPVESIGEHVFSTTVMAAMLVEEVRLSGYEVDGEKLLKMAILHESGEILVGDIPNPSSIFMGKEVKQRVELAAGRAALTGFPDLQAIVEEFELGMSLESRLIRSIDKLQMLIKVMIYESQGKVGLEEFWHFAGNIRKLDIPIIDTLFDEIRRLRGKVHLDFFGMLPETDG